MAPSDPDHVDDEWPALDDRLVEPGTRYEMYDGELVYVPPALPPHATRHSKISALVEAHTGPAFDVACDMLTRVSRTSDVAPDVSVFPVARDPSTGRRQLEHLSFEVVSTESLAHAGRKAAKLIARGVRRVFAIDIERDRVLEWSKPLETWSPLEIGGRIEDPALAVPLPLDPLLHAAKADDAIARALLAKRNPVLEADRARAVDAATTRGITEGAARGKAEALLVVLAARGIALSEPDRARILGERDPARLDRWIDRAARGTSLAEVLASP
jgi:Uma2 family endonuclease